MSHQRSEQDGAVARERAKTEAALRKSLFVRSALASGLLTAEEIDEAVAAIKAGVEGDKLPSDEQLAARLVDMRRINRWQSEQLRAGRTLFTLGAYQCVDSLGQGGMGQVYKAEHSIMGRTVAVKVLPKHKTNPETIANFMREIRMQAALDHENLVRAYDAGHDGNVHFLVTEYVPGTDLRRLIRKHGRLQMALAASIVTQAAKGLQHAHQRGLLHRDVKPGNILVAGDGRTKVSDLGLSGYFNDAEQIDSRGGKVVGTADYLAPEQISTPDRLTPASDIYALGCTLYYTVTGKVPFPGGSARDKARAHLNTAPLDPRRLATDLDDAFVDVIADMMAKNPEERIQHASEVINRLSPWTHESVVPLPIEDASAASTTGRGDSPVRRPSPAGANAAEPVEPVFLVQPAKEHQAPFDSASQPSLGTQPVAAAAEETLPMFPETAMVYPASYRLRTKRGISKQTIRALAIAAGIALLGLVYLAVR